MILNKISDYVTEKHLKEYFERKFDIPVQEIKMSIDKPMIVFRKEILDKGYLKTYFKIGTRNRSNRYRQERASIVETQRRHNYSYDQIKEKLETEELKRPNFLYELRYETINRENFVDFEMDSVNNFTFELEKQNIGQVTFACKDYQDKGGRFMCRSATRLPNVPMVDAIFCLVFAPLV